MGHSNITQQPEHNLLRTVHAIYLDCRDIMAKIGASNVGVIRSTLHPAAGPVLFYAPLLSPSDISRWFNR